jgi:hypothetical protein
MKNDRSSNHKHSYKRKLNESENVIQHVMDINYFQNNQLAFHTFGLLGGPVINTSHENIIDIESKLRGIDPTTLDTTSNNKLPGFQIIEYDEIVINE